MAAAEHLSAVIVGAGLMGRWHAYYAARAGARIAAVVDPRREAAEGLAKHYGAVACGDLAAAPPVRVAHLCAPPLAQAALIEQALDAGLDVLCEKPPAPDAATLERLLESARSRQALLCPVHQFPFQRGFQALSARRTLLGEPVRIEIRIATAGGEGLDVPARRALPWDIVPHALSLLFALQGSAVAGLDWEALPAGDRGLEIRAVQGRAVLSAAIDLDARPPRNELHYSGARGTARVDLFHGFCVSWGGPLTRFRKAARPFEESMRLAAAAKLNLAGRLLRREWAYPGLPQLIEAFYGAVKARASAPIAASETLAIYRLIDRLRA